MLRKDPIIKYSLQQIRLFIRIHLEHDIETRQWIFIFILSHNWKIGRIYFISSNKIVEHLQTFFGNYPFFCFVFVDSAKEKAFSSKLVFLNFDLNLPIVEFQKDRFQYKVEIWNNSWFSRSSAQISWNDRA